MSKKVHCVMLVDDNRDDNFFHERVITKNDMADVVVTMESAKQALTYLKNEQHSSNPHPDLIFLDINMPGMNGWEFIEEYKKLDKALQSKMVVVMLTTSENPDDQSLARSEKVIADFRTKPLTKEMMEEILDQFYKLQP